VPAALDNADALTGLGQVTDDLLGRRIDHRGAHGDRQHQVFALGAGALGAPALLTVLRSETSGVTVIDQGVQVDVGFEPDRPAIAAVTAIGATLLDEFLPAETHHAVAAVTRFYVYGYFIDEFHLDLPRSRAAANKEIA